LPTVTLEGKHLARIILSIKPLLSSGLQEILSLMRKAYEMDAWCFDLPTIKHHQSFKELMSFTEDETLIGLPHIAAEEGASLSGIPLHRFEAKVNATITKNLFSPDLIKRLKEMGAWRRPYFFPIPETSEVFTQKEIDRISFDSSRFDRALSPFQPGDMPFLLIGERYGDWLLGLGRMDLLKEMVSRTKEKGFIPILSGQWATFFLPKAKSVDAAAYAIPINKKRSFFDLSHASDLIKKFDKPVISLDPLAGKGLLAKPDEAFSFLFDELKIYLAIAEVSSEGEMERILKSVEKISSLRPRRKA
ncbi:MAG TPA: hypothetical protein VLK23_15900, partial [Thermodesulfobacteriota bacterium]|nr:hypothetical protein [Thermodesulfobacteriota bacterium]